MSAMPGYPRDSSEQSKKAATTSLPNTVISKSSPLEDSRDGMVALNDGTVADSLSSYSYIKEKMRLEKPFCGFPKVITNQPCKMKVDKSNLAKVESQLELLSHMTQTSEGVEVELRKLIVLVNCKYHSPERFIAQRLKSWKQIFPAWAEASPSVGEQIRKLLGHVSGKCVGTTIRNAPCKWALGGQKVQHATKTISELTKPEVYLDEDNRVYALEALITYLFCHHHNKQGQDKLMSWKSNISEICKSAQETKPGQETETTEESMILRSRREGTPPAECWPNSFDNSKFITEIEPGRPTQREDAYELVKNVILSALDPDEQEYGVVYLYQVDGNKDFVKIGYTSQDVKTRAEKWTFNCNRSCRIVYPPKDCLLRIPHAKRVEALCHAELKYANEIVDCKACIVRHQEWFRVSIADAVLVLQKWETWMKMGPYKALGENIWCLSKEIARQTKDMAAFMQMVSEGKAVAKESLGA